MLRSSASAKNPAKKPLFRRFLTKKRFCLLRVMDSKCGICIICVKSVLFSLSVLKELECYLLEERVGENVLFLFHIGFYLLAKSVKLGSKIICRTAIDPRRIADDLLSKCGVDLNGSLTVLTLTESLELLDYHLVSLAADYVEYCLSTNDLGGRSYKGRITNVCTYARNFLKNLDKLIFLTCLLKLGHKVGKHSAGNLIKECVNVNVKSLGIKETFCKVLLTKGCEVLGYLIELCKVDAGIVLCTCEGSNESLRGGAEKYP